MNEIRVFEDEIRAYRDAEALGLAPLEGEHFDAYPARLGGLEHVPDVFLPRFYQHGARVPCPAAMVWKRAGVSDERGELFTWSAT